MCGKISKRSGLPLVMRITGGLLSFAFKLLLIGVYIVSKMTEIILVQINNVIKSKIKF